MENQEKVKKERSNKGLIRFFYLLIIVSITVIAFIVGQNWDLIYKKVSNTNLFAKVDSVNDGVKGIENLYETYKANKLNVTYFSYYAEPRDEGFGVIDTDQDLPEDFDQSEYKIFGNYLEIEGLKNKEVERKINKRIKQYMLEQITWAQKYNYETLRVWESDVGSFSNVLSISVYTDIEFPWEEDKSFSHGLNFDLNTGEEIKFSDVFTYDADIEKIISDWAYQKFGREYSMEGYVEIDETDYMEIEDEVSTILKKYERNPDIDFTVTPIAVTAIFGDKSIDIPLLEYKDQVAIYHRFLSNSTLFEEGNNEKGKINVLINESDDNEYNYCQVERVSDNLFVSIRIEKSYYDWKNTQEVIPVNQEDYDEMIKYVEDKVGEYKNKNDGKARFYEIGAYSYDPDSDVKFIIEENCYEADKDYCENAFFPWLIRYMSVGMGGTFIYEEELEDEMKDYIDVQKNNVYREDYFQYQEDEEYHDGV